MSEIFKSFGALPDTASFLFLDHNLKKNKTFQKKLKLMYHLGPITYLLRHVLYINIGKNIVVKSIYIPHCAQNPKL